MATLTTEQQREISKEIETLLSDYSFEDLTGSLFFAAKESHEADGVVQTLYWIWHHLNGCRKILNEE